MSSIHSYHAVLIQSPGSSKRNNAILNPFKMKLVTKKKLYPLYSSMATRLKGPVVFGPLFWITEIQIVPMSWGFRSKINNVY